MPVSPLKLYAGCYRVNIDGQSWTIRKGLDVSGKYQCWRLIDPAGVWIESYETMRQCVERLNEKNDNR